MEFEAWLDTSTCLTAPINAITACYGENKSIPEYSKSASIPWKLLLCGTVTALCLALFDKDSNEVFKVSCADNTDNISKMFALKFNKRIQLPSIL